MQDSKLSRRDMLRASTVLAAGAVFAEPISGAEPAESDPDSGRPQGGYARVLYGDGNSTRGRTEQGVRSQISRNQGSREAIGGGARVPAHRQRRRDPHP